MESNAVALLKGAGKQGMLLAELAQQMSQTETKILEVIDSLTENGQVKVINETHNGKSMPRIVWQDKDDGEWDTLEGCPCFVCPDIDQCGASQPISPWGCEKLNTWIKQRLD